MVELICKPRVISQGSLRKHEERVGNGEKDI